MSVSKARLTAFRTLDAVNRKAAYANLELAKQLSQTTFDSRDAGFITELVAGTCRLQGTYDLIIAQAASRSTNKLQPAVLVILRMVCHELLTLRTPDHAAVHSAVQLAHNLVGSRVSGLVNAASRKIAERNLSQWLDVLASGLKPMEELALRNHHPAWIVESFAHRLDSEELPPALAANNINPQVHLAVRPTLMAVAELRDVTTGKYSPYCAYLDHPPNWYQEVKAGIAGVQDEGSQLVTLALTRAQAPKGVWLDLCAGPGGKTALLAGLATMAGEELVANELQPQRARLVRENLKAFPNPPKVVVSDGRDSTWHTGEFSRTLVDVPCSGLGALRRRPESRWRRNLADLENLIPLQHDLLASAIKATMPGGVIAYVTCSPHLCETHEVVDSIDPSQAELLSASEFLPEVPDCADGSFVQLWPQRHGSDAMFLALLRRM
ncbi:MAG: rRNA cytosine-C5-methylase [Propionibacteriaceae bacterium]|nr:rRNA cytosine-C5-methylase [Propionibacteriaceae bacterium]